MKRIVSFLLAFASLAGHLQAQASTESPAKPQISQFVLYAERSIEIGHRSHAEAGDVGVRSPLAVVKNSAAQLRLEKHGKCGTVFSPSTSLENDAEVGNIWTNSLKRSRDTEVGQEGKFPGADMPPLPLAIAAGTGVDITVTGHTAKSLIPGIYGAVVLHEGSTLRLVVGRYVFASLKMGERSGLLGERSEGTRSGGVDLRIVNGLQMGEHSKIAPQWAGAKAEDFSIAVAGSDPAKITQPSRDRPSSQMTPTAVVSIGKEAHVHGLLAAPHGTIRMAEESRGEGAFAGFDIVTDERVEVEFESGFPVSAPGEHGSQQLHGYYSLSADSILAPLVGPVPQTDLVRLAIGLPARDAAGLHSLAAEVSDPNNPKYRKYLTVDQFVQSFGAPPSDYQALIQWAQSAGLHVDTAHRNKLLLSVTGTAAQAERALFTNLTYRLRVDGSQFVTVDREPSLNFNVAILRISGLNDAVPPLPKIGRLESARVSRRPVAPDPGSGDFGGLFGGKDFRAAYAFGLPLTETGQGQTVALFQYAGYFEHDIAAYKKRFSLPDVQIQPVLVNGSDGHPEKNGANSEVSLDIEMAISMAPGLDAVIVYEGPPNEANSILAEIAAPPPGVPRSRQVSVSWGYNIDDNTRQILLEFAIQGQSFCAAAGDREAYPSDPGDDVDQPYTTLVGGTELSMAGAGVFWQKETTWNDPWGAGGGGILTNVPIPSYQKSIDFSQNGGSPQFRNAPDLSLVAKGIEVIYNDGQTTVAYGTSAAAPLWAGFLALVNQRSQKAGLGAVGFANTVLYSIGESAAKYAADFNDIKDMSSNSFSGNPGFRAVQGFDLATGWGTPKAALINDLAGVPTEAPAVTVTYHQVGACNGFATNPGGVSAGPNAAYVIFGIESVDNSQTNSNFAFDPTHLFVHQGVDEFIDPSLRLATDILGGRQVVASNVPLGQNLKFAPSALGALIVATVNADGAVEANQTPYSLGYNRQAVDPQIKLVKSDASRTAWPLTEDCSAIVLQ